MRSFRPWLSDALLAAVLGVLGVVGTIGATHGRWQNDRDPLDALGYALMIIAFGALAARRRWPLAVLGVVSVAISVYIVLRYPYGPSMAPLVVAMYTVAVRLPIGRSLAACGLAVIAMFIEAFGLLFSGKFGQLIVVLPWAGWLVIPWAVGAVVRLVRRAREEENRERVYAERLRVAREVHDVVAHGLAAINMQAQIALHVLERRPGQARVALDAINQSSRDALDELRSTLAMFRAPVDPSDADGDGRRPVATLDQLDRLVSRMAGSGLAVTVEVSGERPDLPSTVDLAAYRIIQESLTNVLRHAGPASATVRVDYGPDALTVEVTDNGHGRSSRNGGHGIAGMIERATALGGALEAGPRPEGGFRVHARLPLRKVPA